jgi:hypothetical protein
MAKRIIVQLKNFSANDLLERFKQFREEFNLKTPYSDNLVIQAIEHHQKLHLRFNLKDGITRDRNGEQARFSDGQYQPFEFDEDGALFNLMGDIYNTANRVQRGYTM